MIRSIRTKLFVQISLIIIFFATVNWVLNETYLEQYYINQKRELLIEQAEYINRINEGNYREIASELKRIEEVNSASIIILSGESRIRYSSHSRIIDEGVFIPGEGTFQEFVPAHPPGGGGPRFSVNEVATEREVLDEHSYFEMRNDRMFNMTFLVYHTELDGGDTLEIMVILNAIQESAAIANQFILYVGFALLLLAGIWAYFASRQFTKPILHMNQITEKMASLDFSQACNITSSDEMGQLGGSINYLSRQLSSALADLQIKNQQLELEIQRERMLVEMRKTFVSNVSHELRTPIALIGGYAEGLKLNIHTNESKKNFYCDVILDEAQKMNLLVGDLLDLSQVESGTFKLDKQVFCINDLLDRLLEKYEHRFEKKGVQVIWKPQELLYVNADFLRTEQILVNYLNNALHHVDEAGMIRITLQEQQEKVRIGVFNSGSQVPEACQEQIWHSFYKGNAARTRDESGYGLGLSIVKAIQVADKNQWGFDNLENGVEFWFTLSAAKWVEET